MNTDKSLKNLFNAALERDDPTERARFLDEACGTDSALREQVERLLRAQEELGAFMAPPSRTPANLGSNSTGRAGTSLTEKPGDKIGRYKLLQQIGEGGCGVVYMAEQEEPVRRCVALKVIKLGMDTKQVIARFEAERQALALMDHPNIARVLDAGATDSGRPFFVMELVRGTKITEFCNEKELSTTERLDLFLKVCSAIQHAHQKGVIHRDVKPSNILVTLVDGAAVPKVIDFGIAKATNNQPLTDKTLFTAFEQFIGTPAYMSPEQADMSGVDIDTRTDIYSLGVVLYELLTGGPPFDQKKLLASGLDGMRRTIREEEPLRPSNRLSTMAADALTTTAHHRHTEPPKLIHSVRGDLDWIVMKCLEKDRARRYETANGLAMDVKRHLDNEPVTARPPSAAYQFRKFARRNWRVVTPVSLITLTLALATIISLSYAHQARVDRQLAVQKADEANRSAEAARSEAAKSDAVVRLLRDMLNSANPNAAKGANYTVRELLDEATQRLKTQLDDQPEVEATLRQIIGSAYAELRLYDRAELHLQRSLDLYRELFGEDDIRLAGILLDLARNRWLQGSGGDVEEFGREALRIYHKHGDTAGELHARNDLFMNAWGRFRLEDAERMAEESIAFARSHNLEHDTFFPIILSNLSFLKLARGDTATALRLAREAVDKHQPETSSAGWGWFYLGLALRNDSRLAEAEENFRKSLSIWRRLFPASDEKTVGRAVVELRDALEAQGNVAELAKLEQEYPNELMASHYDLAAIADALMHDRMRAIARWRKAIELAPTAERYEKLARFLASPSDVNLQDASQAVGLAEKAVELAPADADAWLQLARVQASLGQWTETVVSLDKVMELGKGANPEAKHVIAQGCGELARLLRDRQKLDQAERVFRYAISLREPLSEARPEVRLAQSFDYNEMADVLRRTKRLQDAEAAARTAVELKQRLVSDFPENREYLFHVAHSYFTLGYVMRDMSREPEAVEAFSGAAVILNKLTSDSDVKPPLQGWVGHSQEQLGDSWLAIKRLDEAAQAYQQALVTLERLEAVTPAELAHARSMLISVLSSLGRDKEVADELNKLKPLLKQIRSAEALNNLAWTLCKQPNQLSAVNQQAVTVAQEAVELDPNAGHIWNTLGTAQYRTGNWKEAIAALEKSMERRNGGDSADWFFLAMAHWQLGEKAQARELYDRAVKWMAKNQPTNNEMLQFRAEAAGLLGIEKNAD